jgi:hypothetical protein
MLTVQDLAKSMDLSKQIDLILLDLRSCVGMRSESAALCTFRFDRSLNTPFSVISIGPIVGCGLGPLSGIVLLSSLVLKTDENFC